MLETQRASRAWEDYLALGPMRSLERLVAMYRERTGDVPTTSLRTLKGWSEGLLWQARIAGQLALEREEAEGRIRAERAEVFGKDFGLDYKRVVALSHAAGKALRAVEKLDFDTTPPRKVEVLVNVLRGCLEDIAAEVGGRQKQINVLAYIERRAREDGLDPTPILEEARKIVGVTG